MTCLLTGILVYLKLLFKNLLDNACKFSNEDVDVEFQINDKHINIIISDKGVGIPPNEINSYLSTHLKGHQM